MKRFLLQGKLMKIPVVLTMSGVSMSTVGPLLIAVSLLGVLPLSGLFPTTARAQSNAPPALYGSDDLARPVDGPATARDFQPDRYVGVFYFLWLQIDRVHDNTKILKENPLARAACSSPPWGRSHAYHFWGEPMFGYYRSEDPWVLRRHAALLSDAGVDFLVFDTTNGVTYDDVVRQLCKVFDEQRRLGEHVPRIVFMVNSCAGQTAQRIYESFYKPSHYPELWFRWKGKPLLICDPDEASDEVRQFFTLRKAHWPFDLVNTHNAWHWEATYPQVYSHTGDPSKPEQVNVSAGQNLHQETGRVEMMSTGHARGRSFHAGGMDNRPDAYRHGFNFQEQWERAFELDPEVVFVTGWNEWVAMQLNTKDGPPVFCDQFDLEFSRDVEMMKGGYGDNYYMQMAANIRRFKGVNRTPPASPSMTIELPNSFRQWNDVEPTFRDHALETLPRDFSGCGDLHYRVRTGRNDFRVSKVTHDRDNVYFLAQTGGNVSAHSDPNWMWLLIEIPEKDAANWEGFHFIANREPSGSTETSLEICQGGWNWTSIGTIRYRVKGDRMHIAIPKLLLGIHGSDFVVQFKWIDNSKAPGDILDGYINGDTAPDGRFRYRYEPYSRAGEEPQSLTSWRFKQNEEF